MEVDVFRKISDVVGAFSFSGNAVVPCLVSNSKINKQITILAEAFQKANHLIIILKNNSLYLVSVVKHSAFQFELGLRSRVQKWNTRRPFLKIHLIISQIPM